MSPVMIGCLGIIGMFVLIALQVPIAISMIVVGLIGYGFVTGFETVGGVLASEVISKISNPDQIVVPLFLLMGSFATVAGLSGDIYKFANTLIGHVRGGLAHATIIGSGFFGAICGSSAATTATFSRVSLPEMTSRKYSTILASGTIAAGGCLGTLVPPSVPLVIYAVMTEQFIVELFIAAAVPALMCVLFFFLAIFIYAWIFPNAAPKGPPVPWKEKIRMAGKCWGALLLILAVIGGIYGGVFTVNEGAAVGAGISLAFVLLRKRLSLKNAWTIIIETAVTTGMVFMIMIGAAVFGYFITISELPQELIRMIQAANIPNWGTLAILIIVYIVLGCVFDTLAAMLITLPFVVPMITGMGYSLVWWGLVNLTVIELGVITPPIGLNVFVIHGITQIPLESLFRGVVPFIIALVVELILLTAFPSLITWLPSKLM